MLRYKNACNLQLTDASLLLLWCAQYYEISLIPVIIHECKSHCPSDLIMAFFPSNPKISASSVLQSVYLYSGTYITGCPECYQVLETVANRTMSSSKTANLTLTDLSTNVIPFESALAMQQGEVEAIVERTANISNEYQSITTQFDTTSSDLQQMSDRFIQIDNSLTVLKAASTTVFVLASTTEELMDRTIEELLVAQNEVSRIASELLPDIQMLSDAIGSSFNSSFTAAESLTSNVDLRRRQVQKLYNLTATVQQLSVVEGQLTELTSIHENNTKVVNTLHSSQEHVKNNSFSLRGDLTTLASAIDLTLGLIKDELDSLDSVPEESLLNRLIMKAADTRLYAENLMDMVADHQNRLDSLVGEVQSTMTSLSALIGLTNDLGLNISTTELTTLKANSTIHGVFVFIEEVVHRAEYILDELSSFSNDSFRVGSTASAAIASVEMINSRAIQALRRVQATQERIQQLAKNSTVGSSTAVEAATVLQQVQEVCNHLCYAAS